MSGGVSASSRPCSVLISTTLLIDIRLEYIDGPGAVLAVAGPCRVRVESGLPYLGDMLLDTADLLSMEQAGVLRDTVLHEIAHVLGFGLGSLWQELLQEPSVGGSGSRVPERDTHFRGEQAIAAFDAVGGSAYAGAKVPVENDTGRYGRGRWTPIGASRCSARS